MVTNRLFRFVLAYNDFAFTSMLFTEVTATMIVQLSSFLGSSQEEENLT